MAVNKVEINGATALDLTQDTVTPESLLEGVTAHNAAGETIVGTHSAASGAHAATHAVGGSDPVSPQSIGAAPAVTTQTVTLTAAGWDATAKTQTVAVTGVVADELQQVITPAPAMASMAAYNAAGILCTAQGAGTLTFTASTNPTEAIVVCVAIQGATPL